MKHGRMNMSDVTQLYIQQIYLIKLMHSLDPGSLSLIKYEPAEVLFQHKASRMVYRYFSCPLPSHHPQVQHPALLRGIPFDQGLLYQKEQSTLLMEIGLRARSHVNRQFSEEEIVNTFVPLFSSISQLHLQGVTHGSIHLDSIVIVDQQIKLRDWCAPSLLTTSYYPRPAEPSDDLEVLGLCLINCLLLTSTKPDQLQFEGLLEQIIEKYSKHFVLAVIVIAKGYRECYPCILSLLEGECKNIDARILDVFIKLKTKKDGKKKSFGVGEPGLPQQISMKKIIFNPIGKKMIHYENSENKLEMEGKRSIEKLSKAFEKFNLTHELMNKKLNEEEKRVSEESIKRGSKVPIMNLSNFGIENTHKRQGKEKCSPLSRPRPYSKKK